MRPKQQSNNGQQKQQPLNSRRIAFCGIFTALAMIFGYVESLLPIPVPVPGVKLGIANIAVICVLYLLGEKEAFLIDLLRILLLALLFGNFNSFLFSMSGGMLSIAGMILLKKTNAFSMTGVSIIGGVLHNAGQILAAVWIMGSSAILYYLPVLLVSGVLTGIVIGIAGSLLAQRVQKLALLPEETQE